VHVDLLGEGIGQSSEPAKPHADVEVLPFDVRRADVLPDRCASDGNLAGADAFAGAVFALGSRRRVFPVQLDQHGIIDVAAERSATASKLTLCPSLPPHSSAASGGGDLSVRSTTAPQFRQR